MAKLLAIGVSKNFVTWSVPLDEETPESVNATQVSAKLYGDEKSGGIVPSQIILVAVEDGAPVVKWTADAGDFN